MKIKSRQEFQPSRFSPRWLPIVQHHYIVFPALHSSTHNEGCVCARARIEKQASSAAFNQISWRGAESAELVIIVSRTLSRRQWRRRCRRRRHPHPLFHFSPRTRWFAVGGWRRLIKYAHVCRCARITCELRGQTRCCVALSGSSLKIHSVLLLTPWVKIIEAHSRFKEITRRSLN